MNRQSHLIVILLLICCSTLLAQYPIRVGEVSAKPGEKKSGFIIVPEGDDGPESPLEAHIDY